MQQPRSWYWAALLSLLLPVVCASAADPATGWRGNGTGLWPKATPPLQWSRIPRGALDGLRAQAAGILEVGFDVLLEGTHLQVRHGGHDADHDERDDEREPRAERRIPQPFRHSGAHVSAHGSQQKLLDSA